MAAVARAAGGQDAGPGAMREFLRAHQWKHRVLVVFAPAGDSPAYRAQAAALGDAAAALDARDVRVLAVSGAALPEPLARSAVTLAPLPEAEQRALRRQLGVADGEFRVLLVGKDGGVKLRRRTPLSVERLLAVIDGMPMGAAEARRRARGPTSAPS